jgi:hypothetical protein
MRRAFRPSAERLEAHVVLSSLATAMPMATVPAAAVSPTTESLTTDKSVYRPGQPVHMTLSVTNTSDADLSIAEMRHGGGFSASHNFSTVWRSDRGRLAVTSLTLAPGQTHTVTATWNGRSHGARATGDFMIDSTLANNSANIEIERAHVKSPEPTARTHSADGPLTLIDQPL